MRGVKPKEILDWVPEFTYAGVLHLSSWVSIQTRSDRKQIQQYLIFRMKISPNFCWLKFFNSSSKSNLAKGEAQVARTT